mmetsp:Transcript_90226/g.156219  ORF Transcript_90226/g.156219 Transcript_90226/m.156219 type:complete len:107 (+) Transcript_90226:1965-2285(+)
MKGTSLAAVTRPSNLTQQEFSWLLVFGPGGRIHDTLQGIAKDWGSPLECYLGPASGLLQLCRLPENTKWGNANLKTQTILGIERKCASRGVSNMQEYVGEHRMTVC